MLSQSHARRAAHELVNRFGEVAIAAAMLRSQQAQAKGQLVAMADWRRIAAAAAQRLNVN
jgi:hypothetical protein